MMAGLAKGLIKCFNKNDVPATLFVMFTSGGVDFVGGYSFYQFLKHNLFQTGEQIERKMGTLTLKEQTGEEIHEMMFEKGQIKYPAYWKQIV